MTLPFHPLSGQEFVKRRKNWRLDRVYFYDGAGELVSLPAAWTDVVDLDPFVIVAAGLSAFHIDDLIELSDLVAALGAKRPAEGPRSVKRNTP